MQETRQTNGIWALYVGTLFLIAIISLVVWCEYKTNHTVTWLILSAGGFVFWIAGFVATRREASAGPTGRSGLAESSMELCFVKFDLNGYFFQPYEQLTLDGRQRFRLLATPSMSPEQEAAVIRYLINEGLTEKMWPRISRRIEEEANWAFFA
jgi:hypothetical protein